MVEPPQDPEALRRRLYRDGASQGDVDRYLAVAGDPEEDTASTDVPPSGPRRRRWVWAACGAAVVVAGGALLSGALEASAPSAVPSGGAAAPVRTISIDPATGELVPLPSVVDHGARPAATGRAQRTGTETYLYTVAAGDTVSGIARRFRLCEADVLVSLPYGFDSAEIPPGEQLLLARAAAAGLCRTEGIRG